MTPTIGQYVKIFFRTGAQTEGTVEFWSDNKAVLKSTDEKSLLVIQDTLGDIMLIKILLENTHYTTVSSEEIKTELEQEFEQVYREPSSDELRIKKLAELKNLLAQQEKKIIAEKIKDHHVGESKLTQYTSQLPLLKKTHG